MSCRHLFGKGLPGRSRFPAGPSAFWPFQWEWEVRYTNANPTLTEKPTGKLPADLPHLRRAIRRVKPDILLTEYRRRAACRSDCNNYPQA